MSRRSFTAICATFLLAQSAFAHRPYERVSGTFRRADGTIISIVRHRVDGIIAADPVSIQFRLPDGAEVVKTEHIFDAVELATSSGIEIYQFRKIWLPIAVRVDAFDGYELRDITTSRRTKSIFVHFAAHWISYILIGGLTALLLSVSAGVRSLPRGSWRSGLRALGFAIVGLVGFCLGYDVLVFEPLSPILVLGCAASIRLLPRLLRGRTRAIFG